MSILMPALPVVLPCLLRVFSLLTLCFPLPLSGSTLGLFIYDGRPTTLQARHKAFFTMTVTADMHVGSPGQVERAACGSGVGGVETHLRGAERYLCTMQASHPPSCRVSSDFCQIFVRFESDAAKFAKVDWLPCSFRGVCWHGTHVDMQHDTGTIW